LAHAPAGVNNADTVKTKFEAMLLTSMIQEMLPKDTPSVYGGEGTAGDMWRSMLAEKVADQIAKSGTLGIAKRLFDGGHSASANALTEASRADQDRAQGESTMMNADNLSLPLSTEALYGSYLFARGKAS